MKKIMVLLTLLFVAMTVFAVQANVGIMDLTKLDSYVGLKDINQLISNKSETLLAPLANLEKGYTLSKDEFADYRSLKARAIPSAEQKALIEAYEKKNADAMTKLQEINNKGMEATDEEKTYFTDHVNNYNTNANAIKVEAENAQTTVSKYSQAMLAAIKDQLYQASAAVAKAQKLNLILNKNGSNGDEIVIWADGALDVSDLILDQMNKAYKAETFIAIK